MNMRTIKIRRKRIDSGEWIVGNLFIPNKLVSGVYICQDSTFADFLPNFEDGDTLEQHAGCGIALGHFHEVHPESVGQFTGLLDRNKKEIYEEDIVNFREHPRKMKMGVVFYRESWGRYCIKSQDDFEKQKDVHSLNSFGTLNHIEVIGNIFDNPELLK